MLCVRGNPRAPDGQARREPRARAPRLAVRRARISPHTEHRSALLLEPTPSMFWRWAFWWWLPFYVFYPFWFCFPLGYRYLRPRRPSTTVVVGTAPLPTLP